jgi:hypothetical protein
MTLALVPYRLRAQRLVGPPLDSPADVVGHLGAVQSQDHGTSLWSIGRRCDATITAVDAAFAAGDFVRTHVLRPTWHHVLLDDLPDLLAVTTPRVRQLLVGGGRRMGIDEARLEAGTEVVAAAVRAHAPTTRAEVAEHLADAGLEHTGSPLAHYVMNAELAGLVASGPMRGKQHTYVPLDLPEPRGTHDERLAWIARLYARGHGPFDARDLAWWTTLTLTEARRAVELADLRPVEIEGHALHTDADVEPDEVPPAMLLSNFDELISYTRDPADLDRLGSGREQIFRASGLLLLDGALAGSWTRTVRPETVEIDVRTVAPVPRRALSDIESEAARFGRFLEREAALSVAS